MSKTITSPVKRFPGTLVLSDPLTLPQAIAYDEAMSKAKDIEDVHQRAHAMLPGLCPCVEEWHLQDARYNRDLGTITPDTFPSSPTGASIELLTWLFREVIALYQDDDPNA